MTLRTSSCGWREGTAQEGLVGGASQAHHITQALQLYSAGAAGGTARLPPHTCSCRSGQPGASAAEERPKVKAARLRRVRGVRGVGTRVTSQQHSGPEPRDPCATPALSTTATRRQKSVFAAPCRCPRRPSRSDAPYTVKQVARDEEHASSRKRRVSMRPGNKVSSLPSLK